MPDHGVWPIFVHMLIIAGVNDIAQYIMRTLISCDMHRPNMERALSLLQEGTTITAAYVARGTQSYNLVIGTTGGYAPPPVVTNEILALPTAARLLDVGCGTGLTGAFLRQSGFSGYMAGVDLVTDMVEAVPAGTYDELAVADACAWLANDERKWDTIISFGMFIHLPEAIARQVIALAAERLNAGGMLAFNAPEQEARIINTLSLGTAASMIAEAGLDLEAVKRDEDRTTYLCRKLPAA